jgi:serine/threonine-protein kinase
MPILHADWPRLLSLVDEALDVPEATRPAWLAALDLDEPLRASLLGLLEQRRVIEQGALFEAMPFVALAPGPGTGARVGPWRLLREIGRGGMSTVFLAERADGQGTRRVALKLPHAGPGQELLARRLLRERDILAALAHLNIARLYDVGVTEAGTPYLAMEYVEGTTLLLHADERRLGLDERVQLFGQVLAAVQYAHAKLVLHRDLKPGNILVDGDGVVKLLDFGIAKALEPQGAGPVPETELTRLGGRHLTPAYASPEQLTGAPLGTASDVYALGVLLHELLTGERPYVLADESMARLEEAILGQEPRAPSRRVPTPAALAARRLGARALRKALAGDLDAIVLKALQKAPARRYASVEALAGDLAAWRAGAPVAARVPSAWYYLGKFVRRHRLATSLGALGAAAVMGAAGVAVAMGLEARREAAQALSARRFMEQLFEDTDPDLSAGHAITGQELLARGRAKLLATPVDDTALPTRELLLSVARAQLDMGDAQAADATLAALLERLRAPGDAPVRIEAWLQRAACALELGHFDDARADLARARDDGRAHGIAAASERTLARLEGHVALQDGRVDDARAAFDRYFALVDRAPGEPADNRLLARLAQAKLESMAGHRDTAFALLQSASAQAERDPALSAVRFDELAPWRANLEVDAGRYAGVERWLPGTLADCNRALGVRSLSCRKLAAQQVRVLLKVGRAEEAVGVAQQLREQLADDRAPARQADAAVLVARSAAAAGRDEELPALAARLERIGTSRGDPALAPQVRLLALNTGAELALSTGDAVQARTWTGRARALADEAHLATSREARKTALFEALAQQAQGDDAAALRTLGAQCDEASLAASRLAVLDRLLSLNCARALARTGRRADAIALVTNALPVLRAGLGADAPMVARAERLLAEIAGAGPRPAAPRLGFFC